MYLLEEILGLLFGGVIVLTPIILFVLFLANIFTMIMAKVKKEEIDSDLKRKTLLYFFASLGAIVIDCLIIFFILATAVSNM